MISNPIIVLHSVDLQIQENHVFENFDLTIYSGENTCLSGASGRGKSSLLKVIQGYLIPAAGAVEVYGQTLTPESANQIRSQIAYVPQNIHLPVKNGVELLSMISATQRTKSAKDYLKQLGLDSDMLERPFDEMSGGQKQRVVIAVCLSLEREILLLDEPTASLDEAAIDLLIGCISKLKNTTVVSASHNEHWIASTQKVIQL